MLKTDILLIRTFQEKKQHYWSQMFQSYIIVERRKLWGPDREQAIHRTPLGCFETISYPSLFQWYWGKVQVSQSRQILLLNSKQNCPPGNLSHRWKLSSLGFLETTLQILRWKISMTSVSRCGTQIHNKQQFRPSYCLGSSNFSSIWKPLLRIWYTVILERNSGKSMVNVCSHAWRESKVGWSDWH